MRVGFTGRDFSPPFESLNGQKEIRLSWSFLVWSAVTVGRRNLLDVLQYGRYSFFEIVYRAALLYANLRESASGKIVRSAAYNGLDPSEKGAISYFLGMTMSKAFGELELGVPWLMHLDVYGDQLGVVATKSRSRPDLIGRTRTSEWSVLESKGRTNEMKDEALSKAKEQTSQLLSISGQAPTVRVGLVTHFGAGRLQLAAADPPPEKGKDSFELELTREEFSKRYYAPFRALVRTNEVREVLHDEARYLVVRIEPADLSVGLREDIASGEIEIKVGVSGSAKREDLYAGADGVLVQLGDKWTSETMRKELLSR